MIAKSPRLDPKEFFKARSEAEFELNNSGTYPQIVPHPDGKPWTKCCSGNLESSKSCQCFCRKPPKEMSRLNQFAAGHNGNHWVKICKAAIAQKDRFFCVHQITPDGYHRECAGWAALVTKNGHDHGSK